jgi:hypothetical protein
MTELEYFLIFIIIIIVIAFVIYYFFKGTSRAGISLANPVESRVDEYLDRRFESLVTEWGLLRTPAVKRYLGEHEDNLAGNESDAADLRVFEKEIDNTLQRLEDRLDALEKELASQGK